jgi:hypothetical protein
VAATEDSRGPCEDMCARAHEADIEEGEGATCWTALARGGAMRRTDLAARGPDPATTGAGQLDLASGGSLQRQRGGAR